MSRRERTLLAEIAVLVGLPLLAGAFALLPIADDFKAAVPSQTVDDEPVPTIPCYFVRHMGTIIIQSPDDDE